MSELTLTPRQRFENVLRWHFDVVADEGKGSAYITVGVQNALLALDAMLAGERAAREAAEAKVRDLTAGIEALADEITAALPATRTPQAHGAIEVVERFRALVDDPASEVKNLRRWKTEAADVLLEWEKVWQALGKPGRIGEVKSAGVVAEVERLTIDRDEARAALAQAEKWARDLTAGIGALCEEARTHFAESEDGDGEPCMIEVGEAVLADDLRALVDDPAAALAEVCAEAWDEGYEAGMRDGLSWPTGETSNPYRAEAEGAGQ